MNEEYGLKGCVQRLEQRRQSRFDTEGLRQVPDHNSFDVEFSFLGQVSQKTFYTHGGVVHGSTHFQYDESRRLIRTEDFDRVGTSVGWSELVYSEQKCEWANHDTAGVITSHGVDEYDGNHLVLTSTFDSEGRRKVIKSFDYSNGRLSKSDSRYLLPDGTLHERWLSDYDLEGRIRGTYGLKSDGSPLGDGKYLHEYEEKGRVNKVWSFNEFGDDNIASKVTVYEYVDDDRGNWIERREFHLWRNDSYRSSTTTTRKLEYCPRGVRTR
jgi:hypothetical protein